MKISNVILNTTLFGSVLLFTAAGLMTIEKKNHTGYVFADPYHSAVSIQIEQDILAAEALNDDTISFESAFQIHREKEIQPHDILDISEEEYIQYP